MMHRGYEFDMAPTAARGFVDVRLAAEASSSLPSAS